MSITTFFHCMQLELNQQLWNFPRLYIEVNDDLGVNSNC